MKNLISFISQINYKIHKFIKTYSMACLDVLCISITLAVIYIVSKEVHESVEFRIYLVFSCLITVLAARFVYIWKNRGVPKEYKLLTKLELIKMVQDLTISRDKYKNNIDKLKNERDILVRDITQLNDNYTGLLHRVATTSSEHTNRVNTRITSFIQLDNSFTTDFQYIEKLYKIYNHVKNHNIRAYHIQTDIIKAQVWIDSDTYNRLVDINETAPEIEYIIIDTPTNKNKGDEKRYDE